MERVCAAQQPALGRRDILLVMEGAQFEEQGTERIQSDVSINYGDIMVPMWNPTYFDERDNLSISGFDISEDCDFNEYIQKTFNDRIEYYCGKAALEEVMGDLGTTGFDTTHLEATVTDRISYADWGECFAFDQIENHLGIRIPWPPHWDKRSASSSLPGADVVGLKYDGDTVMFIFGEVKTSSQEKSPPDVVTKKDHGMIDQIQRNAIRDRIKDIIQYLNLRSGGKDWEDDFRNALENYLSSEIGFSLIGVLVRDTVSNPNDLDCVFRKLTGFVVPAKFHAYYISLKIHECIDIYHAGGDYCAAS